MSLPCVVIHVFGRESGPKPSLILENLGFWWHDDARGTNT